jgi:hypothetical protein
MFGVLRVGKERTIQHYLVDVTGLTCARVVHGYRAERHLLFHRGMHHHFSVWLINPSSSTHRRKVWNRYSAIDPCCTSVKMNYDLRAVADDGPA